MNSASTASLIVVTRTIAPPGRRRSCVVVGSSSSSTVAGRRQQGQRRPSPPDAAADCPPENKPGARAAPAPLSGAARLFSSRGRSGQGSRAPGRSSQAAADAQASPHRCPAAPARISAAASDAAPFEPSDPGPRSAAVDVTIERTDGRQRNRTPHGWRLATSPPAQPPALLGPPCAAPAHPCAALVALAAIRSASPARPGAGRKTASVAASPADVDRCRSSRSCSPPLGDDHRAAAERPSDDRGPSPRRVVMSSIEQRDLRQNRISGRVLLRRRNWPPNGGVGPTKHHPRRNR